MPNISRNFSLHEFACRCDCNIVFKVDPKLVKILQSIRNSVGVGIRISSGARCALHNAKVSPAYARTSWHIPRRGTLFASDITLMDPTQRTPAKIIQLYTLADQLDVSGLGLYRGRIHVDTRPMTIFKGHDRARWIDKTWEWKTLTT